MVDEHRRVAAPAEGAASSAVAERSDGHSRVPGAAAIHPGGLPEPRCRVIELAGYMGAVCGSWSKEGTSVYVYDAATGTVLRHWRTEDLHGSVMVADRLPLLRARAKKDCRELNEFLAAPATSEEA